MIKVKVERGDILIIEFYDGDKDNDGQFEVHLDSSEFPNRLIIKESAGLSGNVKGLSNEILYEEKFGTLIEQEKEIDGNNNV